MVTSALTANSAIDFHRNNAGKTGWILENESLPWLRFTRGNERLSIYITANSYGSGSTILYSAILAGE
jgi:hypothetical protein